MDTGRYGTASHESVRDRKASCSLTSCVLVRSMASSWRSSWWGSWCHEKYTCCLTRRNLQFTKLLRKVVIGLDLSDFHLSESHLSDFSERTLGRLKPTLPFCNFDFAILTVHTIFSNRSTGWPPTNSHHLYKVPHRMVTHIISFHTWYHCNAR